jgi:hypothetical protein
MKSETALPLKSGVLQIYVTSLIIGLLTGAVSISGLVFPEVFYPNQALIQTFIPNNLINLSIGIPILLISMFSARHGKIIGLLFWLGAIIFNLYIFISYSIALPFRWNGIIYLSILFLDIFSLSKLIANIDGEALGELLQGRVYEKFCGGIIAVFGFLFLLRALFVISTTIFSEEILSKIELAPNISDLIVAPIFVIAGISLWRKKPLGYLGGLGLLFLVNMLFIGLILYLLLQPLLSSTPLALQDLIILIVMTLISLVPLSLFLRGAALSTK